MNPLAVRRVGEGPRIVLVHGGLGPELTWSTLEPLSARWELIIPWRRGFPPSPGAELIDFEADARDIAELLGEGAHVVGFSYGGLGAAMVASQEPERVHSLTLIETPLYSAARGNAAVENMIALSEEFIAGTASPARTRDFLEIAGMDGGSTSLASLEQVRGQVGRLRSPLEAEPDLPAIAAAVPSFVVSGGHQPGIEAVSDAIAAKLASSRAVFPGAGHAAHRAAGFNEHLEAFLRETADRA